MRPRDSGVVVWLLLAAAGAAAGALEEAAVYRTWLERERKLVVRAEESCLASGGGTLEPLRRARALAYEPGPGLTRAQTAWLAEDCAAVFAAGSKTRLPLIRGLRRRLESYQDVAEAPPLPAPGAVRARDVLRRVLHRPEFEWERAKTSWWERLWQRVNDWWWRFIYGDTAKQAFSRGLRALAILGVLLLCGLAFLLARKRTGAAGWAGAGARKTRTAGRRPGARDGLDRRAEENAGAGRFREALRLLYVALLAELDRADVIRLVKHKTNRDYGREIEAAHHGLAVPFAAFTDLYEARWYGRQECGANDYALARRYFDETRGMAR